MEATDDHDSPTVQNELPESKLVHEMFELMLYGSLGFAAIMLVLTVLLSTLACIMCSYHQSGDVSDEVREE